MEGRSLDDVAAKALEGGSVKYLKIDVEGLEADAVRGGMRVVKMAKYAMIELTMYADYGESGDAGLREGAGDVMEALDGMGKDMYRMRELGEGERWTDGNWGVLVPVEREDKDWRAYLEEEEAEIGREMYIVISGEMKMMKPNEAHPTILGPGEYFGELCALDINPINLTTTTALHTSELYSLSRDDVFQQFAEMPEVLGHMKDIALEAFIVTHKLDAEVKAEDQVLNDFLQNQTAEAVQHKTTNATVDTRRKKKRPTELQPPVMDVGLGVGGAIEEGSEADGNQLRAKRQTLTSKLAKGKGVEEIAEVGNLVGDEVDRRMENLETKMDMLLSMMMKAPSGSQGQGVMTQASQMRQQALKEQHEDYMASKLSPTKMLSMQSMKRVGSFTEDLESEIGKEAKAAIAHRRQSLAPQTLTSSPPPSGGSSNALESVNER